MSVDSKEAVRVAVDIVARNTSERTHPGAADSGLELSLSTRTVVQTDSGSTLAIFSAFRRAFFSSLALRLSFFACSRWRLAWVCGPGLAIQLLPSVATSTVTLPQRPLSAPDDRACLSRRPGVACSGPLAQDINARVTFRPEAARMGLESLSMTDDRAGRIWRVAYRAE